jgi:hypothetical protein
LGGLFGSAVGGMAGAHAGETLDRNVLDNVQCLECGLTFRHRKEDS